MAPHFGSRVSGHEAFDKAVREEKGGASVFGVRVVSAVTGSGPVAEAKRATEHGVRVLDDAQFTDTKGEPTDALSIEEIRNGLTENPTFFDSWYEGELAREDGPREEALHIFREVEKGIKGQGRREILDEIAGLLGETAAVSAQRADLAKAQREQAARQRQREQENVLLRDADRVKKLKERDENVRAVKESDVEGTQSQIIPADTGNQVSRIADEMGLDISGGASTKGASKGAGAKPEGAINPGTQQPGSDATGVPEGEGYGSGSGRSATSSTSTPQDEDDEEDHPDDAPTSEELNNSTVADLEAYLGEEALAKIKQRGGTGANGAVVKADLLRAAKRKARKARENGEPQ